MPRKRVEDRWPWPTDSALERRERIARSYRQALLDVAPEICFQLDAQATRLGHGWVAPQPANYEEDDLLTLELVADYGSVQPRTVDLWVSKGLKVTSTPDGNRYRFGDVQEFLAARRLRRRSTVAAADLVTIDVP
jgi:hypothetical protein